MNYLFGVHDLGRVLRGAGQHLLIAGGHLAPRRRPARPSHAAAAARSRFRNDRTASGLTLIEVLLVLAILTVIAGMVVPKLIHRQQDANISATRLSIKGLEQALKLYAVDHDGEYPTTSQGLDALLHMPEGQLTTQWHGPYLEQVPRDAWNRPFSYARPGQRRPDSFDVSSMGPDGVADTSDDITNWSELPSR